MTPAELGELAAGYQWRQERERELAAWVVYYLMAVHIGRKTPSIDALLGRADKSTTLPNGMTVSGDSRLLPMIAGLLDNPAIQTGEQDEKLRQMWERVQARRNEGAAE